LTRINSLLIAKNKELRNSLNLGFDFLYFAKNLETPISFFKKYGRESGNRRVACQG